MVHVQAVLFCELEFNFTKLVVNDFANHKEPLSM
jgi:hypothetical protein